MGGSPERISDWRLIRSKRIRQMPVRQRGKGGWLKNVLLDTVRRQSSQAMKVDTRLSRNG